MVLSEVSAALAVLAADGEQEKCFFLPSFSSLIKTCTHSSPTRGS